MQLGLDNAAKADRAGWVSERTCRLLVGPVDECHADIGIEQPHYAKKFRSLGGESSGSTISPVPRCRGLTRLSGQSVEVDS